LKKHQRQSDITVTGLMLISGSGITLAGTKFQMARPTRIQSKEIMLNSVIIWRALRLSFIVSMAGSFINNVFQTIQLFKFDKIMSW
jgi:hypothetical protein